MNSPIPAFQDSLSDALLAVAVAPHVDSRAVIRLASHFLVVREGQTPEVMMASSRDEALSILERQVKAGQAKWAALYVLDCGVAYKPSVEKVMPDMCEISGLPPTRQSESS